MLRAPTTNMPVSSLLLFLPLALFSSLSATEEEGYRNFSIYEISDPSQQKLHELLKDKHHMVDILSIDGSNVRAMIPPHTLPHIRQLIEGANLKYKVLTSDVQRDEEENFRQRQLHRRRRRRATSFTEDLTSFLTLPEMDRFQKKIIQNSKVYVEQITIGQSAEKRDINLIRIKQRKNGRRKRTIFIDAGIHAREWIAPATANYIIYQLTIGTDVNNDLLKNFDWEIIPVLNPDGYAYSYSKPTRRYWRKNRQVNQNSPCRGTDLNRNFGYPKHMPEAGGSRNPCDDIYSGPYALSAPESRVLRRHLLQDNSTIVAYLSLHSFGRYILYPWGYSKNAVPYDAQVLKAVAQIANSDPLMSSRYKIGTSAKTLYEAAGGSDDFAKGGAGIKFSYTIELPPWQNATYTFAPPESSINKYVKEAWGGIKALVRELNKRTRLPPLTKVSTPTPTTTTTTKTTNTTTTTTTTTTPEATRKPFIPTTYLEFLQYFLERTRPRDRYYTWSPAFGRK